VELTPEAGAKASQSLVERAPGSRTTKADDRSCLGEPPMKRQMDMGSASSQDFERRVVLANRVENRVGSGSDSSFLGMTGEGDGTTRGGCGKTGA
jgi:hypothetical protein